jgi:hypothetical protein
MLVRNKKIIQPVQTDEKVTIELNEKENVEDNFHESEKFGTMKEKNVVLENILYILNDDENQHTEKFVNFTGKNMFELLNFFFDKSFPSSNTLSSFFLLQLMLNQCKRGSVEQRYHFFFFTIFF